MSGLYPRSRNGGLIQVNMAPPEGVIYVVKRTLLLSKLKTWSRPTSMMTLTSCFSGQRTTPVRLVKTYLLYGTGNVVEVVSGQRRRADRGGERTEAASGQRRRADRGGERTEAASGQRRRADRGGERTEAASGQRRRADRGGERTEAAMDVWDIVSACLNYLIKKLPCSQVIVFRLHYCISLPRTTET